MKRTGLTEGNVVKSLVFFALPLLGSSLIQQLYSTVDLVFVGQFLGTEASAAVGASSLIITCLVGFFTGMAVGTSVFTAQYFGAKQWDSLHRLIQTMFLVGIGGGLVLMLLGIGGAELFLTAMGTPRDIMPQAVLYLRVYMVGMVPVVMYNLLSGVIRALGDSRNPMIFQCVGGVLNIVGDYVCIAVFGMGVEGTAIATVVSQAVAACCAAACLIRLRTPYALRLTQPGLRARRHPVHCDHVFQHFDSVPDQYAGGYVYRGVHRIFQDGDDIVSAHSGNRTGGGIFCGTKLRRR